MKQPLYRPATDADLPQLGDLYVDAVTTIGPLAYSAGQIKAWASRPTSDPEAFRTRVSAGPCWVVSAADCDGEIGAFAVFVPPDHLDFLYTRGTYARQGLAADSSTNT